jgi:hypothetical protein
MVDISVQLIAVYTVRYYIACAITVDRTMKYNVLRKEHLNLRGSYVFSKEKLLCQLLWGKMT